MVTYGRSPGPPLARLAACKLDRAYPVNGRAKRLWEEQAKEVRVLPGKATPDADDSAKRIGICCQTLRGRCYNNTSEGLTLPTPRSTAPPEARVPSTGTRRLPSWGTLHVPVTYKRRGGADGTVRTGQFGEQSIWIYGFCCEALQRECYNDGVAGDQAAHWPPKGKTRSSCFQVIIPMGSGPRPQPSRAGERTQKTA